MAPWPDGRSLPADQGFDEWYGIPNSSDEAYWPDNPMFDPTSHQFATPAYVMESRKGEQPKNVKVYNTNERRLIDRELTDKAIAFVKRQADAGKPFFAFVPYTQTHHRVNPHPAFDGKTGNGFWADVLSQIDSYVGELIDPAAESGVADNTIFIFTSDNGPQGFSGP